MTGFGRAELKTPEGRVRVEIKTANHKFLEMSARLPGHLMEFEDAIRKIISQGIRRGKITVYISSPDPSVWASRLVLNEPLAKEVFRKVRRLGAVLKLGTAASDPSFILSEVMRYPDVLIKDASYGRRSPFNSRLRRAIGTALRSLGASRLREGKALRRDLAGRLAEIKRSLDAIEKRIPRLAGEFRKSLEARIKEFLKNGQVDHERLTLEAALYAKNSDVSEEVTRLKSHLDAMRKTLGENGELGRKIDFIAQEMTREANTMGAKSSDILIAGRVIHMKSAIEKIREQAQNVE